MSVPAPAIDPALGPAPASQTVSTAPSLPSPVKRKYNEVQAALAGFHQPAPAKRRKRGNNYTLSTMDRLITAAKYFTRAVNPYMDIGAAMSYGPEPPLTPRAAPNASNTILTPPSELEREQAYVKAFEKLFSIVLDLLDVVKQLYLDGKDKPEQWNVLVKQLSPHFLISARQSPTADDQDISERRGDETDPPPGEGQEPPSDNDDFLPRVAAGRIELTAKEFPSFLYEDGSYDVADLDNGLLRGHLTLRTLRHIWTAPASALYGLDGAIPTICNARLHGVLKVDAEMIAYAVMQARTMLSTADWKFRDGSFDYEVFFDSIVQLFANPDDQWTKDTLACMVFGDQNSASDAQPSAEAASSASTNVLTQRAARRAAATAAAPASTAASTAAPYPLLSRTPHTYISFSFDSDPTRTQSYQRCSRLDPLLSTTSDVVTRYAHRGSCDFECLHSHCKFTNDDSSLQIVPAMVICRTHKHQQPNNDSILSKTHCICKLTRGLIGSLEFTPESGIPVTLLSRFVLSLLLRVPRLLPATTTHSPPTATPWPLPTPLPSAESANDDVARDIPDNASSSLNFTGPETDYALEVLQSDTTKYLSGNGFRAKAFTAISTALTKRFPKRPKRTTDNVGNQMRYVKGIFEEYEFMRGKSGVGWDDGEKKATAESDFVKKFTEQYGDKYAKCFKRPCPYYNRLAQLFGGNRATGDKVLHLAKSKSKKSKSSSASTSASASASASGFGSAPGSAAPPSPSSPQKRKGPRQPLENLQNDAIDVDLDFPNQPASPKPYDDELLPPTAKRRRLPDPVANEEEIENSDQPKSKAGARDRDGRRVSRNAETGSEIARGLKLIGQSMSALIITKADTSHVDAIIDAFTDDPTLLPDDPEGEYYTLFSDVLSANEMCAHVFIKTVHRVQRIALLKRVLMEGCRIVEAVNTREVGQTKLRKVHGGQDQEEKMM
ncbi:hypothetical protein DFH09DRAFT_1364702 [Mycena vulgaris]|nr:hypothetical protein DFH09DRAFT_1364702 [Mycena vulgaris]